MRMHNPPHPGRILKEALEYIPMSVTDFAAYIGVSRVALSRVVNCRAGFTPEMSIRISLAFNQGKNGDIWFKMQTTHDFWKASQAKGRKKILPLKIRKDEAWIAIQDDHDRWHSSEDQGNEPVQSHGASKAA